MSEKEKQLGRTPANPNLLEREEARLWRIALLFVVLLATALAAVTWERLQAYFGTYVDYLEAQCKICPGGVLGSEYEAIPEEMRHEARLLMQEIYQWLVATLELGRRQGALFFHGDCTGKAIEIGAALQGGLQIARMAGTERFHQVLHQLSLELTAGTTDPLP